MARALGTWWAASGTDVSSLVGVIERAASATPVPQTAIAPQYRGEKTLFHDQILRLLSTRLSYREIAKATGETYQTVTRWRRWAADHQPELLAA